MKYIQSRLTNGQTVSEFCPHHIRSMWTTYRIWNRHRQVWGNVMLCRKSQTNQCQYKKPFLTTWKKQVVMDAIFAHFHLVWISFCLVPNVINVKHPSIRLSIHPFITMDDDDDHHLFAVSIYIIIIIMHLQKYRSNIQIPSHIVLI